METIDKAAKNHAHIGQYGVWEKNAEISFKKGIEFAQRWISVDSELPELEDGYQFLSKEVIVKSNNYTHFIAFYNYTSKNFVIACSGIDLKNVTYWRPIELK